MKKRILQCLSLILCAAMLAIPAAAAETADEEAPARLGPAAYWGTVTWMDEDTFLLDSGKEDGLGDAVVVHVGDAPYLDAVTGNTLNLETLEDGDARLCLGWPRHGAEPAAPVHGQPDRGQHPRRLRRAPVL